MPLIIIYQRKKIEPEDRHIPSVPKKKKIYNVAEFWICPNLSNLLRLFHLENIPERVGNMIYNP